MQAQQVAPLKNLHDGVVNGGGNGWHDKDFNDEVGGGGERWWRASEVKLLRSEVAFGSEAAFGCEVASQWRGSEGGAVWELRK